MNRFISALPILASLTSRANSWPISVDSGCLDGSTSEFQLLFYRLDILVNSPEEDICLNALKVYFIIIIIYLQRVNILCR